MHGASTVGNAAATRNNQGRDLTLTGQCNQCARHTAGGASLACKALVQMTTRIGQAMNEGLHGVWFATAAGPLANTCALSGMQARASIP